MSAAPLKKCPACKKQKLERLIGAGAGVIFKGSGFYQTDYKNSNSSGSDKSDKPSGGDSQGSGGCAPSCGTKDAPTGCKMGKKS